MDFDCGNGQVKPFYFEMQPLGVEFTKARPIRVHHFKPDSYAKVCGLEASWMVLKVGEAAATDLDFRRLMRCIDDGLRHLPQEEKGLRIDFLDNARFRRTFYFQRQPLGILPSRQVPVCVEEFTASSYARERGVETGWAIARVGEHEVSSRDSPQEVARMLRDLSRSLPLWPLRLDLDMGGNSVRTLYMEQKDLGLELSRRPPLCVEQLTQGGYAEASGMRLGWQVLRVGNRVVGLQTDREEALRWIHEGTAHLPEAEEDVGKV